MINQSRFVGCVGGGSWRVILTDAGNKPSDISRWTPFSVHTEIFGGCLSSTFRAEHLTAHGSLRCPTKPSRLEHFELR
jgi:hypothetical protein